jgi:hypothetical protein
VKYINFKAEKEKTTFKNIAVREHEGWVRNVALIECTLGPGKTQGGLGFWKGGYRDQMRNKGS